MNPTMPYVPIENVANEANEKPQCNVGTLSARLVNARSKGSLETSEESYESRGLCATSYWRSSDITIVNRRKVDLLPRVRYSFTKQAPTNLARLKYPESRFPLYRASAEAIVRTPYTLKNLHFPGRSPDPRIPQSRSNLSPTRDADGTKYNAFSVRCSAISMVRDKDKTSILLLVANRRRRPCAGSSSASRSSIRAS
ncbi:uncharacterized protein RAG0_10559 [Rhynchosporium agropyri]|uniref:Uncharacterized protein n=1 Tax=Rhynchosporium agropyri TaxID=914238 RepID=A0A1E1L0C1_9HELO|nr:uncharacterized protein RAG0_10559 [Rhynchosporium agropyri]